MYENGSDLSHISVPHTCTYKYFDVEFGISLCLLATFTTRDYTENIYEVFFIQPENCHKHRK